ncbi:hypothetical protein D3C81_1385670 [compost metagenome]
MAVAGVAGLQQLHQLGVEIVPVGQLAAVERLDGAGLDQPGQEVVGRADQVVAAAAGHQLGLGRLVAVDQVVGGLDAGAAGEFCQGVIGNVTAPVGDIHRLGGLGRQAEQRRGQHGHAGTFHHLALCCCKCAQVLMAVNVLAARGALPRPCAGMRRYRRTGGAAGNRVGPGRARR